MRAHQNNKTDRRLIEEWLPITEIGIESGRERTPLTPYPAPNRLHTWWARRPLIISRAAVLASILPSGADHKKFIHALGIHGDPIKTRKKIERANQEKRRLGPKPYGYDRAFTYTLNNEDRAWISEESGQELGTILVVDPTAGGGSIPLESHRLGCTTTANDLNPVAVLILHATTNWPSKFGARLIKECQELGDRFIAHAAPKYEGIFSLIPKNTTVIGYLWARTIPCPYCSGRVPLSPNWRIAPDGTGVRLIPYKSGGPGSKGRICSFQIVRSVQEQSDGTVSRGSGLCPYPDCGRVISGDEIKAAARSGNMGEQLYAIAYKKRITTRTKTGKAREKTIKAYRAPEPSDDNGDIIQSRLEEKLQEWDIHNTVPTEAYNHMYADRSKNYGVNYWRDLFSPRQLLCHGTSVETFQELFNQDNKNGSLTDIRKAAYGYLAIALDTMIDYNSRLTAWDSTTSRGIRHTFTRHDYGFSWSYGEMAPFVAGLGFKWAFAKTAKCIRELLDLVGHRQHAKFSQDDDIVRSEPKITCKSGDRLYHIEDGTVDAVVMDPPYYDNVMYAELSDFFYVWLKRTAGLVFPELFERHLTDKENEAVANPAKFAGQKRAKALAGQDYRERMALMFEECRRILKPSGIMTVMFMHKSTGAWDALTESIIKAGFYITTSWPINSEARGSLHIKDKAAAKSTILLTCRPRQDTDTTAYWEDVEPRVRESVRKRIDEFEKAGMRGVDTYLSAFGPALEAFSRNWPMKRRAPRIDRIDDMDRYSVTPEDALEAARREVKQWKLDKLINSTPNRDLDPTTAFFVLAWDAFESPKFPYDEALHLAKAVDVNLDTDIAGRFAKKTGEYLTLWDSQKRYAGSTRTYHSRAEAMIDKIQYAAHLGRKKGAESAIKYIESEHLDRNDSFAAALEAVLEVLPPSANHTSIELKGDLASASNDFDALFNIYHLRFKDKIDDPAQLKLYE